jgi:glycosyltransferase involved in cell wall biosynthesis
VTPLRLLYVGPFNSPHVEDLARAMRARGHVVAAGGEIWSGLPASSLPEHGVATHVMRAPMVLWLRRLYREFRPDVVHTHWMPFAALAALANARPFVASAWGSDVYGANAKHRLLMRLSLRRAAVAMTDSVDLVKQLEKLGPRSLRTIVLNWGVELERFRPPTLNERAELKARFGLGPGPVVLSARGVKEIYNPGVVIEAFARVREAAPEAQLVLKHGGTEELLQPEWSEAPGVKVIGRMDYDHLADLFRAADITVSVAKSDSSPRSVWEAMAAGSATVLSDLPWVHELLRNERDTLVVDPNPDALANALARLIRDEPLRGSLVASARQLVEQHRDRDQELERLETAYRELMERDDRG